MTNSKTQTGTTEKNNYTSFSSITLPELRGMTIPEELLQLPSGDTVNSSNDLLPDWWG